MPDQYTVTVYITMNENGETDVTAERDDALSNAVSNIGGEALRTVAINLTMTAPEISEIDVTAPEEASEESATVK